MPKIQQIADFDDEQKELFAQVVALWELAARRDTEEVRKRLHPDYSGWVTGLDAPHDLEAAIQPVGPEAPRLSSYQLSPLRVTVFGHVTGVVHYRYEADVEDERGPRQHICGRWTEIYQRLNGEWIMISVSGGPDGQR